MDYYPEMGTLLNNERFSVSDIAHIILSCGVHYRVPDIYTNVPGTLIEWITLITNALIFPYRDQCFIFPFTLIWSDRAASPGRRNKVNPREKQKKIDIEYFCKGLIQNLDISNLFLSYDKICGMDLYNIGIHYEDLFVASLAVKYYLLKKTTGESWFEFSNLYDADDTENISILQGCFLNLEEGIILPDDEKFTTDDLPNAITHNKLKNIKLIMTLLTY